MNKHQLATIERLRRYAEQHGLLTRGAGFQNGLPYVDYYDTTKRPSERGAGLRALIFTNGNVWGAARLVEANSLMIERDARGQS